MVSTVRGTLSIGLVVVGITIGMAQTAAGRTPAPPCRSAQLRGALVNPNAGAGQRYVTLRLTNRSKASCSFAAYPSMQLVGADGRSMPTEVVPDPAGSVSRVTLAPGRHATSELHWIGLPLDDEAQTGLCEPMPARADITPPGETTPLSITWTFDPVCGHGRLDARPLRTR